MINSIYNSSIILHTAVHSPNNPTDNSFLPNSERVWARKSERKNKSDPTNECVRTYTRAIFEVGCKFDYASWHDTPWLRALANLITTGLHENIHRRMWSAGSFPMGVRANKAKRNEIIFDFRLRPEAEPPHGLIYGTELGDGVHPRRGGWGRDQCPEDATPNGRTKEGRLDCSFLSRLATITAVIESVDHYYIYSTKRREILFHRPRLWHLNATIVIVSTSSRWNNVSRRTFCSKIAILSQL